MTFGFTNIDVDGEGAQYESCGCGILKQCKLKVLEKHLNFCRKIK
jgi:hypothetical protein